jgi:hypothetical protein
LSYRDLFVDQGSDFYSNLDMKMSDGSPINVAGYNFSASMSKSYYSQNVTSNITIAIANTSNGNVYLTMNSAITSNISPGKYVYDVKSINSSNVTTRILEGIITVTPRVTR